MPAQTENKPKSTHIESLWHVQIAVILALVLQIILPDQLTAGPKFIIPLLESVLLVALIFTTPRQPIFQSVIRRVNALTLVALISAANIYSVQRLVSALLAGGTLTNGHQLVLASINVYVTNIIIFGLWFWELDGGGHGVRQTKQPHERDFLFPQMASPTLSPHDWEPTFMDYLYISVTNAAAFSPTDTMPLTRRVKLLMTIQAFVSLVTIALVAARAVNILN
jgi:hypothetical protein